jgi:hypothetical protein
MWRWKRKEWMEALPPLHLAVVHNRPKRIHKLLDAGESLNDLDANGYLAREIAQLLGREDCLHALGKTQTKKLFLQQKKQSHTTAQSNLSFNKHMGIQYIPSLQFEDLDTLLLAHNQVPWMLRNKTISRKEHWLGHLYHEELSHGITAPLSVRWINEQWGYGLFAEETLKKWDFVAEYAGIVKRQHFLFPRNNAYCLRYPARSWLLKRMMVDSEESGNLSRYINHSDLPNLQPNYVINRGLVHIIFLASREIEAGEELLFNYGATYWRQRKKLFHSVS